MIFLGGIEKLMEAKDESPHMDIEALTFCARILRLFLLRKQVLEKKDFQSLEEFFKSFKSFDWIQSTIPEDILSYRKILIA